VKIGHGVLVSRPDILIQLLSGKGRDHEREENEDSEFGKRNQIDLILEILKACNEPVKRTHLIYLAKINHYQLVSYLEMLQKKGMVMTITKPFPGYIITKKGKTLLKLFDSSNLTV
jgi:predicted transcriptional regulator